ncbi:MAG: heparinase II/III family protein [Rhizobiales bacterium]|nr:heparinase II/III family protein [Hyphomicrobiales bacterium]
MSRVSIVERAKLTLLLARRWRRNLLGRLNAHPLIRWRFFSAKIDRLVIAPQDLRTADSTRATEIYSGRFAFAGKIVVCDGRSPFEIAPPSDEWAIRLLGFGWLRHLRAAESGITRANSRALVDEWITLQGSWHALAWRPDILSRRVISWLTQAPLILHDTDVRFYRRFLRNLARQVRFLRYVAAESREGLPRLTAMIALAYAALCMAGQTRYLRNASKHLSEELVRQILPDGGHISRNPGTLIELLADLLPLRHAFTVRNLQPPQALLNAIDRMMPMLRFFRHGDGNFALFNGMGPTPVDLLATVLAYDDARGQPVNNAAHSGYQRIEAKDVLLLVDTGRIPPIGVSQTAHAGCLSFELSSKLQRIVVNCGLPAYNQDSWRQVARATAAHSTVTFNDTSSAGFLDAGAFRHLIGIPMVAGPKQVSTARGEREGMLVLECSHDGYADVFGVVHQRTIALAVDGSRVNGEDTFSPARGSALPRRAADEFAIRFHLHPSIKANRLTDRHGVMLVLPNREAWTFDAKSSQVELEESVYLASPEGPRRTTQIVIYGAAREVPRISWTFAHVAPTIIGSARNRGEEPRLPL